MFPNLLGKLDPANRYSCGLESLEAEHRPYPLFDSAMILLDNMSPADIRIAVARATGRAKTEISGGVTLEGLPELAASGADFVSVGALTHSAPAIDISFEIEPA